LLKGFSTAAREIFFGIITLNLVSSGKLTLLKKNTNKRVSQYDLAGAFLFVTFAEIRRHSTPCWKDFPQQLVCSWSKSLLGVNWNF